MTSKNSVPRKKNIKADIISKKRLRFFMACGFIALFMLILRIAYIQFVDGTKLKEEALNNQLTNRTLTPSRGTIYDSTGKNALAISAAVDTVSVNPTNVKYSNRTEVNKEILAHAFSTIFGLDYTETLEKLNTKTSTFKIAEKVSNEKIEELRKWMDENNVAYGISINEDIDRFYPYDNLASNLIGFTGTDNVGLVGLERTLNNLLEGTARKSFNINRLCKW